MALWRSQAFEQLPEFRTELQQAETPMQFWIELQFGFKKALEEDLPLAGRIDLYADWCLAQPRGNSAKNDLSTAVQLCFLDHVSEEDLQRAQAHR